MNQQSSLMPATPYKGLMPYAEEDAPFFFGREPEREIITANLMAWRLTLLYGPSGVGKSSLLRAGVAHHLRQTARQHLTETGTPEFAVVVFSAWRDDPLAGLIAGVEEAVAQALDFRSLEDFGSLGPTSRSLTQTLQAATERLGGDMLIILDQFEEYFLYHPHEDGEGTFAGEFPRAVNRPDLRVSFLIAIREDALAKLDRFKGRVPNLFDNYLRIEHLDREAARAAIEQPVEQYNRLRAPDGPPVSVEPALIEAVLDQVRTGQVVVGEAGRGVVGVGPAEARIETPYLQLVMTRLWDEEMRAGSHVLRLATLNRLGGAEEIVERHLDAAMRALPAREQEAAVRIFHHLVTPSGTKIAHTVADLAEYAGLPRAQLTPVLEKLAEPAVRILRPVAPPADRPEEPRYEIFHDVLAPAILDWRARAEGERQLAQERQRVRRLRWGIVGLTLVLLAVLALAVFAFQQRAAAQRAQTETNAQRAEAVAQRDAAEKARAGAEAQQKIALSRELAAAAINSLQVDPERSVLLGLQAVETAETLEARNALHQALPELHSVRTIAAHEPGGAPGVAYAPDGSRLASIGVDHTVKLWDADTGELLRTLTVDEGELGGDVAFSQDGRLLAASFTSQVLVWDAASGELRQRLPGAMAGVVQLDRVAFSSDGTRLAAANIDGQPKVWDLATGREVLTLPGHADHCEAIAFSPDGKRLATGDVEGSVRLWDAVTGQTLMTLTHGGNVHGVAFSPDGRQLAAAGEDGRLLVWDTASGQPVLSLPGRTGLYDVAYMPDGKRLVTVHQDGTTVLWDATTGQPLLTLAGHVSTVISVAASPDNVHIATSGFDSTLRLWDTRPGRELITVAAHAGPAYAIAYSPDGSRLATAGADGTAALWDPATGLRALSLFGDTPAAGFSSIVFSPDGRRVAAGGVDGTVLVGDAATGQTLLTLAAHTDMVWGLAFSPDGKRLATTSWDRIVRVWDLEDGTEIATLIGHTDMVFGVAFSGDGQRLFSAGDFTGREWDVTTGQELRAFSGEGLGVFGLALSPDGQRLALGRQDGSVTVWDVASGEKLLQLTGHAGLVIGLAFSQDGTRLATGAFDKLAKVWDAQTGQELMTLYGNAGNVFGVALSPDGRHVATAGGDGTARIYTLDLGELTALAQTRVSRSLTTEECRRYLHVEECPPAP